MNRNRWFDNALKTLLAGIVAVTLASCGGMLNPPPAASPTQPPATDTPQPSRTPTPAPTETPVPTATRDLTATAGSFATAEMDAKLRPILPRLEKLGFDPTVGKLLYSSPSLVTLSVDSYLEDNPQMILDKSIQNFIMQVDVGWNSTSGLAGCGIIFRAEEDLKRGGNYQFVMLRLSGAPAWNVEHYRYGDYQYSLLPEAQFTRAIDERQNAVNTVTLIVRGDTIESYINTTKGMDAYDRTLTEGSIGLMAWQESGKTTCTFSKMWIWGLPDSDNFSGSGAEAIGPPDDLG